jgi:hypothetical protein
MLARVIGRVLLAVATLLALASCGSTTTKTVTKSASTPVTSTATTPTTPTITASTTSTTTNVTTSTTASGTVSFQGAVGRGRQRPASLELTGDGTLFVSAVQWTSWGGRTATGTGNAQYHGCTPNCAAAPSHSAFVSIRLSGIRVCSGRQYYSSLVLVLNSGQLLDKQFVQRSWSPC